MEMIEAVYTLWLREIKRYTRAKSRVLSSIATPFFWLAIVGVGFSSFVQYRDVNYLTFMAPGIVGVTLLFTSIFSGISVIWDRQFGFLKEILVAPVSRMSIMLGKVLGGATIAVVSALIMILITILIGFIPISIGIFPAFIFMILIGMKPINIVISIKIKALT